MALDFSCQVQRHPLSVPTCANRLDHQPRRCRITEDGDVKAVVKASGLGPARRGATTPAGLGIRVLPGGPSPLGREWGIFRPRCRSLIFISITRAVCTIRDSCEQILLGRVDDSLSPRWPAAFAAQRKCRAAVGSRPKTP